MPAIKPAITNPKNTTLKSIMKLTFALLSSLLLGAGFVSAADTGVPATYPLKKCVVSDEDLGTMGKAVKVTHEGTDVYLCCKSCTKDFNKDAAKFVTKVKAAVKK
ncbi:MAG TPA: hypothetical protein DDZ88_15525 [Verrucomicrobiales bacterium]|nr:hypothetical protein [Verrucomicrobiales bacterium]